MTEPAAVSEPGSAVTQPIPAAPPTDALPQRTASAGEQSATQPAAVVAEPCAHCAAPLAPDQRYCLHCGAPRAHVSGPVSGGRMGAASLPQTHLDTSLQPPPGVPGGPPGLPQLPPAHPAAGRNNTLALLAGIGVLLLAMGVGVLIGRAGAGSAKVPPPQVISVGGSPAGASTTPTTSTPTTEAPAAPAAKKKEAPKAKESSAPGSSITKPAPPSAAKNLRSGGSGQSYEQKSKNLPNVVGT